MKRRHFLSKAGGVLTAPTQSLENLLTDTDRPIKPPPLDASLGSKKGTPESVAAPRRVLAGLEPYAPSPNQPWDERRVGYLLRRTMFGASISEIKSAMQKTPGELVDMLLADASPPAAPAAWATENYSYDGSQADQTRDNNRSVELRRWWISLMLSKTISMREKMTLFWHDHFATEYYEKVRVPQWTYGINQLERRYAFGNFKEFVKKITVDPCMLYYLDGVYNTKNRPNENYGRELQELFTMGEGSGYTESDIQNAARALTGWTVVQPTGSTWELVSTFVPARFDGTNKTFHGETANFGMTNDPGVKNLIDKLFEKQAVAEFICRKIYREFVYEVADETIVKQLADIFRNNNYEIKPVLSTLLKSAHFFADENIGAHILHPLEFVLGVVRSLDLKVAGGADFEMLHNMAALLGLQIFDPPNVKGWPGYRSWISSNTLPQRYGYSDSVVNGTLGSLKPNLKSFVQSNLSAPDAGDAELLVNALAKYLLPIRLTQTQIDMLIDVLMEGVDAAYWPQIWPNDASIDRRLKSVFRALFRLGESELC